MKVMEVQHLFFNISGCMAEWSRCLKLGEALLDDPSFRDVSDLRSYAAAALLAEDHKTYDKACSMVVLENGETQDPVAAERISRLLLLPPTPSPERLDITLGLVDIALESDAESPWFNLAKSIAAYRNNDNDHTLSGLDALRTHNNPNIASIAGYFSAMAQFRLNQPDVAAETLVMANTRLEEILVRGNLAFAGPLWWFNGVAGILARAEAEQMIHGEEISPRPNMESLAEARKRYAPPPRTSSSATLEGQPVPGSFTLPLLGGGEFTLPDEQNTNILLLDFWATWCGPCREVMPILVEIEKEYAERGIRYVAVNLRETPDTVQQYLDSANLDITVVLDRSGDMAEAFQVHGIPTMVVIDRNNIIRNIHVGSSATLDKDLRSALDELMAGNP